MQTHTKVVRSGFLNWVFTSAIVSRRDSILDNISSRFCPLGPAPPRAPRTVLSIGPNWEESWESLPSAFSRTVGNWRKRRVCPVGAVSKTMTS